MTTALMINGPSVICHLSTGNYRVCADLMMFVVILVVCWSRDFVSQSCMHTELRFCMNARKSLSVIKNEATRRFDKILEGNRFLTRELLSTDTASPRSPSLERLYRSTASSTNPCTLPEICLHASAPRFKEALTYFSPFNPACKL